MKLTKHFVERWSEYFGVCDPDRVEALVEKAVVLQQFRRVFTPRGLPMVILELRFLPDLGAIVKLDAQKNTLVTVVTEQSLGR